MKHFIFAAAILVPTLAYGQQPAAPPVDPLPVIGELVLNSIQHQRNTEMLKAQLAAAQAEVKRLKDKYEPEPPPPQK